MVAAKSPKSMQDRPWAKPNALWIVMVSCFVVGLIADRSSNNNEVTLLESQPPQASENLRKLSVATTMDVPKVVPVPLEAQPSRETNIKVNSDSKEELRKRSITVPAMMSPIDGQEVVPAHYMAILDEKGECILPGESFCDDYRNAKQDKHVGQSLMSVLRGRCTQPGRQVWDLGSNVGYFTLIMRAMGCHVTMVEPQPSMNALAESSVAANGWDADHSVVLHKKGVSNQPGKIRLTKLWQPGKKNAGSMTVETITIAELAQATPTVEMVKLDIDGPELFTLQGIIDLKDTLNVKNIVAELSVGFWKGFGFADQDAIEIFERYYDAGYRLFLIAESQFPKYPKKVLSQLVELKNFNELVHCFEIPRQHIGATLMMKGKITKNLFFSKDPNILSKVDDAKQNSVASA